MSSSDKKSPSGSGAPKKIAGKFEIIEKIAAGGSGVAWRAKGPDGKEVALKTLRYFYLGANVSGLGKFKSEFELLKRVSHPNIAKIYDFGFDADAQIYYYTSELLRGGGLTAMVGEPTKTIEQMLLGALRALEYLRSFGILHLDIKPGNLLLRTAGSSDLVLIDFGLAGLKSPNVPGGTPSCMSPEAVMRKLADGPEALKKLPALDHRSDIYSLGATFYYALTGVRPFLVSRRDGKPDADATMRRQLERTRPKPPSSHNSKVPTYLDAIIMRMIEFDSADRYPSAMFAAQALCFRSPNKLSPESRETIGAYLPEEGMLVGRLAELAELQEVISATSKGTDEAARIVCIAGACGAGKSRILKAMKPIAQKNEMDVVENLRTESWDFARPLIFLSDDPFLPASMVEDLSVSDVMILKRLVRYAKLLPRGHAAVAFTVNTDFIGIGDAFRALELDEKSCLVVKLGNFSETEIALYLKRLLGEEPDARIVEELLHVTYGNPRFVADIFKKMIEKGEFFTHFTSRPAASALSSTDFSFTHASSPQSLSEYLWEAVEKLPPDAAALAFKLACLRRPAGMLELGRLGTGKTNADDVAGLLSSGFVKIEGGASGSVAFVNPMAPKVIESRLENAKRAKIHDEIAGLISKDELLWQKDIDTEFEIAIHRALGSGGEEKKKAAACIAAEAIGKMHPAAAAELIEGVFKSADPTDWELRAELAVSEGNALARLGRFEDAASIFDRLKNLTDDPSAKTKLELMRNEQLGILCMRSKRLTEAREYFERMSATLENPGAMIVDEKEAMKIEIENNLAGVDLRDGKIDSAIKIFKDTASRVKKLETRQSGKIINNELGEALYMAGKIPEAISVLKEELKIAAKEERTEGIVVRLRLLGDSLRKLSTSNFKEAEDHYNEALELARRHYLFDHELRIRNGMGNLFLQACEWAKAIEQFKHALDLALQLEGKATAVDIMANMGLASDRLGRWKDAIEYLEMALDFAKGPEAEGLAAVKRARPAIHVALGSAYYEEGRLDDAARHLNAAREFDSSSRLDSVLRFNLYGTLAEVSHARGNSAEAKQFLKLLDEIAPAIPGSVEELKKLRLKLEKRD